MKKFISFALLLLVAGVFVAVAADKDQTFEGTLVDSKCYVSSNGQLKGNDHMGTAKCGTMCAKQGIPVALVDSKNTTHVIFGPSIKMADYIGQEARITGKLESNTGGIIPTKVEVKKNGQWEEIKLGADMG
ncbi:hypothetical protein L0156_15890 [bacterium]|nr:hypothetical protein [bacterium]